MGIINEKFVGSLLDKYCERDTPTGFAKMLDKMDFTDNERKLISKLLKKHFSVTTGINGF